MQKAEVTMTKKACFTSSDFIATTARYRFLYPFQIIFCGICNIMNWLFKPSALELENDTLRAQINSQKEELEAKHRSNEELKELNSTLDASMMALQLEQDRIQDSLGHTEEKISAENEKIGDHRQCVKRLEKQLQNIKQENSELDAQLKTKELLMTRKTAELNLKIDEQKQKNRLLDARVRKQYRAAQRQTRDMMELEMGLGQIQAINSWLRSENEGISKDCMRLEEDNRKLKDVIKHLESGERN